MHFKIRICSPDTVFWCEPHDVQWQRVDRFWKLVLSLNQIHFFASVQIFHFDLLEDVLRARKPHVLFTVEGQNVRNFPYPVRIRWSRQPNLVPFYLYNRLFECPENIRNDRFPDVRWSSTQQLSDEYFWTRGLVWRNAYIRGTISNLILAHICLVSIQRSISILAPGIKGYFVSFSTGFNSHFS